MADEQVFVGAAEDELEEVSDVATAKLQQVLTLYIVHMEVVGLMAEVVVVQEAGPVPVIVLVLELEVLLAAVELAFDLEQMVLAVLDLQPEELFVKALELSVDEVFELL